MIRLYVDKEDSDKTIFATTNKDDILYNLGAIDKELFRKCTDDLAKHNMFSVVFPLGKLICVVTMSLDEKEGTMIFVNTDMKAATLAIFTLTENKALQKQYMEAYRQIKYDWNEVSAFELVMRESLVN